MISRKHLKGYSDIILEILNKFSEELIVKATELMNTDDRFLEMRAFLNQNPTEEEFMLLLDKWERNVEFDFEIY